MVSRKQVHWRECCSERIWRCDCGGPHFLVISRPTMADADDDDFYQYLALETLTRADGLWERIKAAWQIVRQGQWCDGDLHLDATTAREVCEELTKAAAAYEDWEKREAAG